MKHSRILASLTAAAMVAGCVAAVPVAAEGAEGEQITITYESYGPTKETMDRILADFEKENPNIKVETVLHANITEYVTAVQTAFASGEGPDVFQYDSPTMMAQLKSQIEPLDEYCAAEWGENWKEDFLASALDNNTEDGVVYGLPAPCAPAGTMWYNKTLLDSLGLEVPTNYEELKTVSEALRADGKQPLLIGAKDSWIVIDAFQILANDFAGDKQYKAYNKEIPFTDEDIVAAFACWENLFKDGIFQDSAFSMTEYMDTYNQFNDEGIAGMWCNGAWNMDMYANAEIAEHVASNEWGVTYAPDFNGDGEQPALLSVFGGYAMNKNSEQKEAAWKLVEYMACDKGAVYECERSMAPSGYLKMEEPNYDLPENGLENLATINELMADKTPQFRGINDAKVSDKLYEVLAKLAYSEITPEDAAAEVDAVINAE